MEQKQLLKIIKNCKKGDKEAFRYLMLEYMEYLFGLSFRILRNEEDAKDAVQETFIKVWQNISSYNEKIKLSTWMYKICVNNCLDKIKSRKRKPVLNSNEAELLLATLIGDDLNESIDNSQLAIIIESLAQNLTPKKQLVFVLKDVQGLESDEIEKITGLNKGQIKSNLYYARKDIRNKLMKMGYEVQ